MKSRIWLPNVFKFKWSHPGLNLTQRRPWTDVAIHVAGKVMCDMGACSGWHDLSRNPPGPALSIHRGSFLFPHLSCWLLGPRRYASRTWVGLGSVGRRGRATGTTSGLVSEMARGISDDWGISGERWNKKFNLAFFFGLNRVHMDVVGF